MRKKCRHRSYIKLQIKQQNFNNFKRNKKFQCKRSSHLLRNLNLRTSRTYFIYIQNISETDINIRKPYLFDFIFRVLFQSCYQLILVQDFSVLGISTQQRNANLAILPLVQRYPKTMQHMLAESFKQSGFFAAINLKDFFLINSLFDSAEYFDRCTMTVRVAYCNTVRKSFVVAKETPSS